MRMQSRACERCDGDRRYDMENTVDYREGILPSTAPLANPFVPFQKNNPPTYDADKGVVRGTLFPGLDLPYHGMVNNGTLSQTHLHELQTLAFAITELGEYLDTHSNDREAINLFRSYTQLYREGCERYEAMHGPLTQKSAAEQGSYNWLKDPWPWDFDANKEGF